MNGEDVKITEIVVVITGFSVDIGANKLQNMKQE
jgi:hypothetical protein